MQPVRVYLRVVPYHVGKRGQAAVVHIRRGLRDVPERGHLELAEIAMLERHLPRFHRARARLVVVVAAEQVERIRRQLTDAAMAARIHAIAREEGDAGVMELAVREGRPEMAGAAVAAANEDPQAALGRDRVARRRGGVALL